MNNEFARRGGSHTVEGMEAETQGRIAAGDKKPREANPYSRDSQAALFALWDAAHCAVTGVPVVVQAAASAAETVAPQEGEQQQPESPSPRHRSRDRQ